MSTLTDRPRRFAEALAYPDAEALTFGQATQPVTVGHGVTIGGGEVYPEVNFTLPTMAINADTFPEVRERFRTMVGRVLERAVELGQPALVLEFEQLFELTRNPDWGAAVTADLRAVMDDYHDRHGLRTALRVTVADTRDLERPPLMRSGEPLQRMMTAFDRCAAKGADILAIESTGGKEVHDQALLQADLEGIAYALGVLAPRDMANLWGGIVEVAERHEGCVPGGDTACGFGNTAMQLAHQRMIPGVLAALVRLMTAPRSLVAVEMGARGPLKDCGYENPILKAVSGVPISMEGKSSACAHSSPLGNIAAATCDLWSNESVQEVRLLGGYAPECFSEVLIYDCRLMNEALTSGHAATLKQLFVASDVNRDPQARVLDPDVCYEAARRIVAAGHDDYARVLEVARYGVEVLAEAVDSGDLKLPEREQRWFQRATEAIAGLPREADALGEQVRLMYGERYLPAEYGLDGG